MRVLIPRREIDSAQDRYYVGAVNLFYMTFYSLLLLRAL